MIGKTEEETSETSADTNLLRSLVMQSAIFHSFYLPGYVHAYLTQALIVSELSTRGIRS